MKAFFMIKS